MPAVKKPMVVETTVVTLYRLGVEYRLQVEFTPELAAENLLARAIGNKSRRSKIGSGAVVVRILTQVPLK
jgi:hypothetical protein